jgi:hypothetical protein
MRCAKKLPFLLVVLAGLILASSGEAWGAVAAIPGVGAVREIAATEAQNLAKATHDPTAARDLITSADDLAKVSGVPKEEVKKPTPDAKKLAKKVDETIDDTGKSRASLRERTSNCTAVKMKLAQMRAKELVEQLRDEQPRDYGAKFTEPDQAAMEKWAKDNSASADKIRKAQEELWKEERRKEEEAQEKQEALKNMARATRIICKFIS